MSPTAQVVAHRGARLARPENTLAAFEEAARLGCDGVELDVRAARDGVPVVLHDDEVDRTTDGHGRVRDLSSSELGRLDAGSWFDGAYRAEPVPLLEDVLEWATGNDLTLHLELKTDPAGDGAADLCRAVVEAVARRGLGGRTVLSSFDHHRLVEAKRLDPGLETAILYEFGLHEPCEYARKVGASAVHCRWDAVSASLVAAAADAQVAVRAFAVDGEVAVRAMLDAGCAGLITPVPGLALRLRDALHAS